MLVMDVCRCQRDDGKKRELLLKEEQKKQRDGAASSDLDERKNRLDEKLFFEPDDLTKFMNLLAIGMIGGYVFLLLNE